jgi:acyl carrier protein
VNWDIWRLEGAGLNNMMGQTVADLGVNPKEALSVLDRLPAFQNHSQIVISTGSIDRRIAQWLRISSLHTDQVTNKKSDQAFHERPQLATEYVAPKNETEEIIADMWQEILGIEKIGTMDEFSDLGGHSLLAIQIISRMRSVFGIQISLKGIFDAPTIGQLALHIEQLIIEEIEEISEDEARQLTSEL